ncbi:MAG TPA: FAD-dependent oxidoreductase [Geomonas sp.]|nr:FAD-dependent oxidoreductase [Geomonas sp.]
MQKTDVVIVGAGPYGLSAAAHLREIEGVEVVVFGEAMSFWDEHMPAEMLLRSPWAGSHLSDPSGSLTLDHFRRSLGLDFSAPVPLKQFIHYGRWFQRQAVPDLDPREVSMIAAAPGGFLVSLSDGSALAARRVVVATGIGAFACYPELFRGLPAQLVSHTCSHRDLGAFAGRQLAVIGAGQSALESAALLHEAGAYVELLIRSPEVRYLQQRGWLHSWPIRPLLYAPPDVGPALLSHLVAHPDLFRLLPRSLQDRFGPRSIRPAGAAWLKPRLENVRLTCGRFVVGAEAAGDRLRLKLDDGSEKQVDHALLGTGYRIDIRKHPFISPELLFSLRLADGYPQLTDGFESSVPGLHFIGAPAAWSFGPLMRFVAGAGFTARNLARYMAREVVLRTSGAGKAVPAAVAAAAGASCGGGSTPSVSPAGDGFPAVTATAGSAGETFDPAGVLVTGADYRALGAARSLGRQGVPVAMLRKPDHLLGSFSRYVQRVYSLPRAMGNLNEEYLAFLVELAETRNMKGWLLLPSDDDMVGFIARYHDRLSSHFRLSTPAWEQLRWACDKRLLSQLAERLEIDQPRTFCPSSRSELQDLSCTFPVVVKPALHDSINNRLERPGGSNREHGERAQPKSRKLAVDKAWRADDRESLLEAYDRACSQMPAEMVMIQEMVPGGGDSQFSYAALCSRGAPLASLTAQRLRQFPMDFGRLSTYVETVDAPLVVRAAEKLLRGLDFTGLIEVEFKLDHRDGRFKLIDVNPRVWGWHTLGARAGVDFSHLLWRQVKGDPFADLVGRPGVGWMYPVLDIPVAFKEIVQGRLSLSDYLRPLLRPLEMAVLVRDDPLPGLLELPLLVYSRLVRRLAAGLKAQ